MALKLAWPIQPYEEWTPAIRAEATQIIVSRTQNALRMMRAAQREKPNPELARKIEEKARFLERMKQ